MTCRWLLLGLLSLCGLSFSQECNQELLVNIDFPGTDITFVYSPDVEHCQMMCTQHPSCLFFTFVRADWIRDSRHFYCYLKSTPSGTPNQQTPLVGVTSGYSLKSCETTQRPCLPKVYQNVDFPGADYKSIFTADYEECQRACTHDPGCQFFTFVNELFTTPKTIRFKCHLKFSWTVPRHSNLARQNGLVSGFSHIAPPADPDCQTKIFPNSNIPGSDIGEVVAASAEHCLALCSAHPSCSSFTFVSQTFKCQMKQNGDHLSLVANNGATSGLPSRFCQPDNSWVKVPFRGVDFRGLDIRFEMLDDADVCQRTCTTDPHCQFYTYVTKNFVDSHHWRRCYLKRDITIPAPPKVAKLENVVSGFSRKNCGAV